VFTANVPVSIRKTSKNFIFPHLSGVLLSCLSDIKDKTVQKVFTRERFLNGL